MIKTLLLVVLISLFSPSCRAIESIAFTSSYTNLNKDCRWLFKEADLEEGQDNSLTCRGYNGYSVQIDSTASYDVIHISKTNSEFRLSKSPSIDTNRKGSLEWRMANSKPFAIIIRSLDQDKNGKATGENLLILGLDGFSSINGKVKTAQNPKANEQARSFADSAYTDATKNRPPAR